jgi:hypothetical protein
MRITNDDDKPSLEDALEHYGVQGMKWGVRKVRGVARAQAKTATAISKAPGKAVKGTYNAQKRTGEAVVGRSKRIKTARRSVKRSQREIERTEDKLDKATTPKARAAAQKNFDAALQAFDDNPKRSDAAKVTLGEAAVVLILAPKIGTGFVVATTARSAIIKRNQRNRGG